MPYTYNAQRGQYRDTATGKFVKASVVTEFTTQSLRASGDVAGGLVASARGGDLGAKEFRTAMRQEIKGEYIRQYIAGRGGLVQMSKSDWSSLGGMLREQYKYLEGLVSDLKSEDIHDNTLAMRARMYTNSAREAFERGRYRAVDEAGTFTEERWVLGPGENCQDCIDYSMQGWVELGRIAAMPGDGSTVCKTNCNCHKEYRRG